MLILKLAFLWHADVQTCRQPWLTPESYRPLMWLSPQSMVGQLLEWPGGCPAPWNWTPGKGTPLSKGVLLSSKQNWVWGLKLSWNLQFHHLQKALNYNWHQWVPPPWGTLYFKKKKKKRYIPENPQIRPIFIRSADLGSLGLPIPTIHGALICPRIA